MLSLARTCALFLTALPLWALDLSHAAVVTPAGLTPQERKAVTMLVEEVEKRTRIRLPVAVAPRTDSGVEISISSGRGGAAEGYRIRVSARRVNITGNDARGVLFGVGGLLRALRMDRDRIEIPDDYFVETAPAMTLRGHQLGYRPKTNSYDGWTIPMWEQYIRDLAVFGTNAIELIPPRSDDAPDSPHFPLPQLEMMTAMSQLASDYGLSVWIWYPAMDPDYSNPATVEAAVKEWSAVFRALPRIDAVFVPGGDPGHTRPKYLMALLEKQTAALRRYHPNAQMWVSPQGFDQAWMDEFLAILRQQPAWLAGVVHGPQVRMGIAELRAAVPKRYPIRNYPDITHSLRCQFPVPDWDLAYALTEGREPINPRPEDQARIFRFARAHSIGFLTYSEGCNDDVNKMIWSALGWNPETKPIDILREFSRYFIGPRYEEAFAQGLLALERNWRGALLTNAGVDTTLEQFREMERSASPQMKLSWRFQQALYRACYDAYNRHRLIHETGAEQRALDCLRPARRRGALAAVSDAETALDRAVAEPVAADLRARVFELAEALFQSIRMQLSVDRYQAIAVGRGANLDSIDVPLDNRGWLQRRFEDIRKQTNEGERLAAIDEILNWANPGPGGFYDDLGNPAAQPHLVRGAGFEPDPEFRKGPLTGFAGAARDAGGAFRTSWLTHAESLVDEPLQMRYTDLDSKAQYSVRVVYAGDSPNVEIRLTANGVEVHPSLKRSVPVRVQEFAIPPEATARGELLMEWRRPTGLGGSGRGCQVSEVWLVRK